MKSKISIIILCFILSEARANLPVIDVSAIANMALQYSQMLNEFATYEKELRSLGIDTGRVGSVLSRIDQLSNDVINGLESIKDNSIVDMFNQINDDCKFLAKNEVFQAKKEKIAQSYTNQDSKSKEVASCIQTFSDPLIMLETKDVYRKKTQEALKKKIIRLMNKHKMILSV